MSGEDCNTITFGMHVAKGSQVLMRDGRPVIGTDGKSPTVVFQTRLSVAWQWFEISIANLETCRDANAEFIEDLRQKAPGKVDDPLWRTCAAGMQATTAVAFALDGLYAEIKNRFPLPNDLTSKWKQNKTARHTQISETIRRTFRSTGDDAKLLKNMLRSVFELRDLAVHPPSDFSYPSAFGDTGVLVDRTFAAFQYQKVKQIVGFGVKVMRMIGNTRSTNESVRRFGSTNLRLMDGALKRWDDIFENDLAKIC